MGRQKFKIEFKDKIESEELKLETKIGNSVKIYSWDCGNKEYPIVALVDRFSCNYSISGEVFKDQVGSLVADYRSLDLYVVSLPNLTNFEKAVMDVIGHAMGKDYDYPIGDEILDESNYGDIKEVAANLQEEAIKDFIKITTAYSMNPVVKHDTRGGEKYVHFMNFCFYPTVFQKLLWVEKKYFPGLLEENNKNG